MSRINKKNNSRRQSSGKPKNISRRNRRRNNGGKLSRIITTTLFCILILSAGAGVWINGNLSAIKDDDFGKIDSGSDTKKTNEEDGKKNNVNPKVYNFQESELYKYDRKQDNEKYINILVMGIDGEREDQPVSSYTRTDVMMLISIEKNTLKTNVISIPRDTYSDMIGSSTNKINSAHAVGGPERAVRVVSDLLDTEIDGYFKANYRGFKEFVDVIGGVTVYIDRDMIYDDEGQNLKIRFYKGDTVTLKGQKAVEYIRWRKNNAGVPDEGDGSDRGRIQKLQYFMKQAMKKTLSYETILNINKLMGVLKNNIQHNLDDSTLYELISSINTISKSVSMRTLEGIEESRYAPALGVNQDYYIVNSRSIMNTLKLFHGEGYLNKRYFRIKIENCSGESGLAADFARFLKGKGYGNFHLVDGERRESSIVLMNGVKGDMSTVFKDEVNMDNIKDINDSEEYYDVIIKLGKDHKKIFR